MTKLSPYMSRYDDDASFVYLHRKTYTLHKQTFFLLDKSYAFVAEADKTTRKLRLLT